MNFRLLILPIFFISQIAAANLGVTLNFDLKKPNPALQKLKQAELSGNYRECLAQSSKVALKPKLIEGWLALTWARCLSLEWSDDSYSSLRELLFHKNFELYNEPFSKELMGMLTDFEIRFVANGGSNMNIPYRRLNPAQRKVWLLKLSENSERENNLEKSLALLKYAAKLGTDSSIVTKIANLKRKLSEDSEDNREDSAKSSVANTPDYCGNSKNATAFAKCFADNVSLKPFALENQKYLSRWDEQLVNLGMDERDVSDVLANLKKIPGLRTADLIKTLFRKTQWEATTIVYEDASAVLTVEEQMIAAKAYDYIGERAKSAKAFADLFERGVSGPDGAETAFRLGLYEYQAGHFDKARFFLAKVREYSDSAFEAASKYYLIRSYQKLDQNDLFEKEKSEYLKKYRWTYYGILLSEVPTKTARRVRNQQARQVAVEKAALLDLKKQKITLPADQKNNFERFLFLVSNKWWEEAQGELSELDLMYAEPDNMMLPQILAEMGLYWQAIRIHGEYFDKKYSDLGVKDLSPFFPRYEEALITENAKKNNISPVIVWSLMRQESGFYPFATSTSNAMGLMQFIPPTAKEVLGELKVKVKSLREVYKPELNIRMGTRYIATMIRMMDGNIPLALASYNAGPTRINKWRRKHPETVDVNSDLSWVELLPYNESIFYVKAILRNAWIYSAANGENLGNNPAFWQAFSNKTSKNN